MRVITLIPTFRDSKSAIEIAEELQEYFEDIMFFLLDDSMGEDYFPILQTNMHRYIPDRKLGQQSLVTNFIRHTLPDIVPELPGDLILVLDADGEDKPLDALKLFNELIKSDVDLSLAKRRKRNSKISFKIGYLAFQLLSRTLTGRWINSGNFSISKRKWLQKAIHTESFNESFSGGLAYAECNKALITCDRGNRRYGKSNMNLVRLVNHGIDVIFTFAPIMRARVFILTLVWSAIAAFNLSLIIYLKISGKTTPGWATTSISSIFQIHILLMIAFAILINITKKESLNNVKFTKHEK
jgi:polyisoprenyl-phosphate glycosyltransferase